MDSFAVLKLGNMDSGICFVTAAKLWGVWNSLILTWDIGFHKVILETDILSAFSHRFTEVEVEIVYGVWKLRLKLLLAFGS